jgi:hypothetical protein
VTDHKNYSLKQVENFLYDAMSTDATPQEIYDVIKGVVQDNYYTYKNCASKAYELLVLLNGNGVGHLTCDKDDPSPECKKSWNDFWDDVDCEDTRLMPVITDEGPDGMFAAAKQEEFLLANGYFKEDGFWHHSDDKVKKWILPVEDDGIIIFPEDLLEAANLVEGDTMEWIDNNDGSYTMKKATKPLGIDEC